MPMPIGAITPDTIFFLPKYKNTIIAKQKLTTTLTNGINANKSKMAARIKIGQCLPIFSQKDSVARELSLVASEISSFKLAAFLS